MRESSLDVSQSAGEMAMAGFQDFTELAVYALSERLSDTIWSIVVRWNNFARDTVGKQLVRAADSIGANIAEGHGSSKLENRQFVRIARRSFNEVHHWLRRSQSRGLLKPEEGKTIRGIVDDLRPKLNAYLAYFDRKAT